MPHVCFFFMIAVCVECGARAGPLPPVLPSLPRLLPATMRYACADHRSRGFCVQADGCVLVKTKQAVLVAEYSAPLQAPECTPIVEGLADYLIGVGY